MRRHPDISWLLLLMALWLAGCTSADETPAEEITPHFNNEGYAWLSLQIPADNGTTRAASFNDTDTEADILDANIFLFKGETEANATFVSAQLAKSWKESPSQNGQVSRRFTILMSNVNLRPSDKIWAYALMNNNDNAITTTMEEGIGVNTLTFKDGTVINASSTFTDFLGATVSDLTKTAGGKDYYLMTSAPMSDMPGGSSNPGSATVSTLTPILQAYLFASEEEAYANPAANINVERTAAKIIAKRYQGENTIADNPNLAIKDVAVALDRYNTKSYVSRHEAGEGKGLFAAGHEGDANKYRFVEHQAVDGGKYRTYWCKDANYTGNAGLGGPTTYESISASDQNFLTHENTFDVANQNLACSTQLIVRVKLSDDTFYYIETTGEEITSDAGTPTEEDGTSASSSFARTRAGSASTMLINYLRQWVMKEIPAAKAWVDTYAGGKDAFLILTADEPDDDGCVNASVSQTAYSSDATGGKTFQETTGSITIGGKTYSLGAGMTLKDYIEAELNKLVIRKYDGGYCYYRIPIRHFDDGETPWTLTSLMTDASVGTIYGYEADAEKAATATSNYLGRYGVVRNTCYTVEIDGIKHIGSPSPDLLNLASLADDNPTQFVSLKISVLPWKIHTPQPIQ